VFAGVVAVRVGGTDERIGETGISHMFEHMAFKGTPEVGTSDFARESELLAELEPIAARRASVSASGNPEDIGTDAALASEDKKRWDEIHQELKSLWVTDQFTREYERRGASGMNATTDSEITKYFVNLPRSQFEFWLYMESERLLRPVLRQFYQERDVVLEERRMRYDDDPEGKLYETFKAASFIAHPYKNPVIGFPFDLKRLTATRLEEFRRRYYVPGNIAVALVGDIRPESDWPLIEAYFGRIPVASNPERPTAIEPPQEGERQVTLELKAAPQFYVAYHKKQYPHPDDAPVSVMLEMLAGSRISPLQRTLVQRGRLATEVSTMEGPGMAYPNLMMFGITPRAPHTNREVLAAFDEALEQFKRSGITEDALQIAKRAIAVSYLSDLTSNAELGTSFATSVLFYQDWRAPFDWYEKAMAVSVQDIERVARQYLVKRARTVAFLERAAPLANAADDRRVEK
jgi:predicted Zn-dependent peptidase